MQRSTIRRVGRRLVLPLWLPLAILVVAAIRFATLAPGGEASGMPSAAVMIALMVLFAWIAAIPLTLAVTYLHRRVRVVAYVCGAVLAPLTVYGAVIGGLFGPVGIVLYPLVLSLPAWIALGITTFIQRNRSDMRLAESA
jgi:hypothetical protein